MASLRLFLHVLAATVWVGGQLTLAALVGALRLLSPDAPRAAARAFNRVAWPAYGLLWITGIWNVAVESGRPHPANWNTVLAVKIVLVVASGVAAWAHARARSVPGLAVWGAVSGLAAVGALYVGVLLAG